jgi:hypothetical protein
MPTYEISPFMWRQKARILDKSYAHFPLEKTPKCSKRLRILLIFGGQCGGRSFTARRTSRTFLLINWSYMPTVFFFVTAIHGAAKHQTKTVIVNRCVNRKRDIICEVAPWTISMSAKGEKVSLGSPILNIRDLPRRTSIAADYACARYLNSFVVWLLFNISY